jgi:hypothetical protein
MMGQFCNAPTHELRKHCPGCSNFIHVLCGCVRECNEWSTVRGVMKCIKADSVVCLACNPQTEGREVMLEDSSTS